MTEADKEAVDYLSELLHYARSRPIGHLGMDKEDLDAANEEEVRLWNNAKLWLDKQGTISNHAS